MVRAFFMFYKILLSDRKIPKSHNISYLPICNHYVIL